MDISEWSHDSNAFKTISSQSDTRNQTSSKKPPPHNDRSVSQRTRSTKSLLGMSAQQLKLCLKQTERDRAACLRSGKYKMLARLEQRLAEIRALIKVQQQNSQSQCFHQEQLDVYHRHDQQMRQFRQVWTEMFEKLDRKQHIMKLKLKVEQEREVRQVEEAIQEKVSKIDRKCNNDRRMKDLQQLEQKLVSSQKYEDLISLSINEKRKALKNTIHSQRMQLINSLLNKQQTRLQSKYERKTIALESKLEQCRQHQVKVFKKNEQRLKQKFLNAINKIDHHKSLAISRCKSCLR